MLFVSDPSLLTLHVLRVRGICGTADVAAASGLDEGTAAQVLETQRAAEYVVLREGRLPGWALTQAGRMEHEELIEVELETSRARPAIDSGYRQFLKLNPELLELTTDWQLLPPVGKDPPVLNDHSDSTYDVAVVKRLGAVDDAVHPILKTLSAALARFSFYGPRLALARAHVEAGGGHWLSKPMIDSYHSVWFELHEDLLATLGIERGSEPA